MPIKGPPFGIILETAQGAQEPVGTFDSDIKGKRLDGFDSLQKAENYLNTSHIMMYAIESGFFKASIVPINEDGTEHGEPEDVYELGWRKKAKK